MPLPSPLLIKTQRQVAQSLTAPPTKVQILHSFKANSVVVDFRPMDNCIQAWNNFPLGLSTYTLHSSLKGPIQGPLMTSVNVKNYSGNSSPRRVMLSFQTPL